MERLIGELAEYLAAFWPAWWSLFAAGALYGLDEVLAHRFPKAKRWLDGRVSTPIRRYVEGALIILALIYAGFAAWQGEHRARLESVKDRPTARVLTARARSIIEQNRQIILQWKLPLHIITAHDSDSYDFGKQFYHEIRNNLRAQAEGPYQSICTMAERGVLIGLKKPDQPSRAATQWEAILLEAGLRPSRTRWYEADVPDKLDFNLFICPAN